MSWAPAVRPKNGRVCQTFARVGIPRAATQTCEQTCVNVWPAGPEKFAIILLLILCHVKQMLFFDHVKKNHMCWATCIAAANWTNKTNTNIYIYIYIFIVFILIYLLVMLCFEQIPRITQPQPGGVSGAVKSFRNVQITWSQGNVNTQRACIWKVPTLLGKLKSSESTSATNSTCCSARWPKLRKIISRKWLSRCGDGQMTVAMWQSNDSPNFAWSYRCGDN